MEEKLLIPYIGAPKWDPQNGQPPVEIQILEGKEGPSISLTETFPDHKNILRIPIEGENLQGWETSPLITKVAGYGKDRYLKVICAQREKITSVHIDLQDPARKQEGTQSQGLEMTPQGLEHCIGARNHLGKITMQTCMRDAAIPKEKPPEEMLGNLEGIMRECRKEKTTWARKKAEFAPSPKLDIWPKGYLREWLKILSRTRLLQAKVPDIEHLEANYHSWTLLPDEAGENPGSSKESYIIYPKNFDEYLLSKKTILLAALENRPEEVLDFMVEIPTFQTLFKTTEDPVNQFLEKWLVSIPSLKGVLVPNFP